MCGFICDEIYYVYDSHNYLAQTNWHEGNMEEYYKISDYKKFPKCDNFKIDELIYMLVE
jgi:hypothetical protein